MCQLVAKELDIKSVSPKALSRELKEYSLAFISSVGKTSCIWDCKKRMFHVRALELIELMYDGELSEPQKRILEEMYTAE